MITLPVLSEIITRADSGAPVSASTIFPRTPENKTGCKRVTLGCKCLSDCAVSKKLKTKEHRVKHTFRFNFEFFGVVANIARRYYISVNKLLWFKLSYLFILKFIHYLYIREEEEKLVKGNNLFNYRERNTGAIYIKFVTIVVL